MEVQFTHKFEAGLASVLEAFFDQEHILRKNRELGYDSAKITRLERSADRVVLVVQRRMQPSVPVPGALRPFQQEWNAVEQEETWERQTDNSWRCDFRLRVEGVPARLAGTMQLTGDASCATNRVSLAVRCDVPLLGRKVARFLAEDSEHKINREYQVIRSLVA